MTCSRYMNIRQPEVRLSFSVLSVILLGLFPVHHMLNRQESRLYSTLLPLAFLGMYFAEGSIDTSSAITATKAIRFGRRLPIGNSAIESLPITIEACTS
jgi:hypothetical protein